MLSKCFPLRSFVVLLLAASSPPALRADLWSDSLQPFLQSYCADCHSGDTAEGGLVLAELEKDLHNAEAMRRWTLIHDRLVAGEMPPHDATQPTEKERSRATAVLARTLNRSDRLHNEVVLRRLNRIEYENTIRDLFDVDVELIQLKNLLPPDTPTSGFDNIGEGLAVSAESARAYLRAADAALDAVFGPDEKPKSIKHVTNLLDQETHTGAPLLTKHIGNMFRKTNDGLVIFQSGYCPTNLVNFSRLRAPPGTYRGQVRVRAVQSDSPVTLRIYGGDTIVGRGEKHLVGYYDVPPGRWTTIEFTDRLLEEGGTFQPKCYGTKDTRKDADTYPEPGIEIADITIEGPLEPWPPVSRAKLLGDVDPEAGTLEKAKAILGRILPRAFRRETEPDELVPYVDLVGNALAEGRSFEDALRLGLKGILCSPQFLFLEEPGGEKISQYALASRLSYFLWSSMPDEELLSLARRGKLGDREVLRGQIERLLKDPRSQALTENYVGQWLDLRDIDFTSPDANLYPEFDELLKLSMVEETHRFFEELLEHDLSLLNFVDSDFTFLNGRLAKHYGISGVEGQQFRKVTLPSGSVRGGVLTQASVLKVTANGTNTSPVLRGAWVTENILGQAVPPPPDDIPSVEPDIRGATTLRDQLAKHRSIESCAACHRKIDPPGFALENFDVIGGWRDHYRSLGEGERPDFSRHPITFAWIRYRIGLPVDASGEMPDGAAFTGVHDYKRLILRDERRIATGITEKLATYALGRQLGFSDRPQVEQIVDKLARQHYGLRSLVHEIVLSDLFQRQ